MSDETGTGNADYKLIAAVVKGALRDAAKGDPEAIDFLSEVMPASVTTQRTMNDWIRAAAGRRQERAAIRAATTPAATTPTANAGNTGAPDVRESASSVMNKAIRSAAGRTK